MYPGPPIAHAFDEAPGRIHVTPAPGLSAPIVAAEPGLRGTASEKVATAGSGATVPRRSAISNAGTSTRGL